MTPRAVVLVDKVRGDASALVNGGKPAAWMCSTPDEIKIIKALELVLRSEVEHLVQGMSEVESRSDKDIRVFPIRWGEDPFLDDVFAEVLHVCLLDHAVNNLFRVSFLFGFPIVTMTSVHGWNEKVELRVSGCKSTYPSRSSFPRGPHLDYGDNLLQR